MKRHKCNKSMEVQEQREIEYAVSANYKFEEPDVEGCGKDPLSYKAKHFLRTHFKNDDSSDVQTQVWQCQFEPDPKDSRKHTGIVATCGGSSICFIRVETGEVILKYSKESVKSKSYRGEDNLYAIAWSTLSVSGKGEKKMNILAAGGTSSKVILIHPAAGVCYDAFITVLGRTNVVISALLFYPKKPTWLFCAHDDGHIQIWDVDIPVLPKYKSSPVKIMTLNSPKSVGEVYNLVFSHSHDLLISGYDGALYVWNIDLEAIKQNKQLEKTKLLLPDVDDSGFIVDSISLLRDDLLAVKCALHGFIYIFSLSKILQGKTKKRNADQYESVVSESLMLKLKWSDTDNYYMNIGVDPLSCLLVCGDDAGALWIYDLASYVTGDISSPLHGGSPIEAVQPTLKLPWPDLDDPEVEKARKLQVTAYDIVMDRCSVTPDGEYIVAVTSNNMVCIWKRDYKKNSTKSNRTSH